ncbi:DMT family transporter [Flavihumibacter profundi]|uniref:DMT family transporter n=1 Tax=Flavihumibacter profundi TaxID=2716883 RepID=UPI001CC3F075|nr:DMT family transporter [Flavihumibacter profundi]MBZ5859120.1 DMT family transporter [Flavihumibacter profundi]
MRKSFVSWSALLACNLMWSLQFTCIKLTQDQIGPFSTVFIPMLLATLFMVPFAYKHAKANKNRKLGDLKGFAILALIGQFPAQVMMTIGTQQSTASNAAIINLTMPVISALLAVIYLKEKMSKGRWISFVIAVSGVILCSLNDISNANFSIQFMIGNALIFMGVLGSGFYNTYCKKIADKYTEIEMLFYTYIFMVILLFPFVLYNEGSTFRNIPLFTTNTWIGLSLLTVFHNFLSMILFFIALKKLEAIQVALSNFLITFFGLPIAAIWLHEELSFLSIAGGILILISTLAITIWEYKQVSAEQRVIDTQNQQGLIIN